MCQRRRRALSLAAPPQRSQRACSVRRPLASVATSSCSCPPSRRRVARCSSLLPEQARRDHHIAALYLALRLRLPHVLQDEPDEHELYPEFSLQPASQLSAPPLYRHHLVRRALPHHVRLKYSLTLSFLAFLITIVVSEEPDVSEIVPPYMMRLARPTLDVRPRCELSRSLASELSISFLLVSLVI